MEIKQDLFDDFLVVAELLTKSWDVDPLYPLLREVYKQRDLDEETALWHSFVMVNYYWIESVETFFKRHYEPPERPLDVDFENDKFYELYCRKERRCVRGGDGKNAVAYLNSVLNRRPLKEWVSEITEPGGREGWRNFRDAYEEEVSYAGHWASYKMADILRYSHGYDITADDLGQGSGSSSRGPIASMATITDIDYDDVTESYEAQEKIYSICKEEGIPFDGLQQMETCLCNFKSMLNGNYYVGNDFDDQMQQLTGVPEVYWKPRPKLFPRKMLGELHDWDGKRQRLNKVYNKHGIIKWWKYDWRHLLDTGEVRAA